jgi:hypothetical protein
VREGSVVSELFGRWLTPPVSPWRVILTATLPFWAYLTLHDIVIYESYVLGGTPREAIASPLVRMTQHLLVLPIVLAAYRLAWRVGWPETGRLVAAAWHVLFAFGFACFARPALTLTLWFADWNMPMGEVDPLKASVEHMYMSSPFYWIVFVDIAYWARATTEFFFVYWFGLALVVGLRFYLDLRDQKLAASRLREDWLKARLDSLAGQLNPHFLFNSLNTVSSFVRGNPDRAETILADLSQLLRTSLRERTRPLVPVADEIEFIERYLAIEGTRFEDRLKVELEADAEVLNARIPSLLLQPLVENAIKHGVSRSRGPATLTVRIGRDGDELKVVIENSYRAGEQGIGNGSGESVGLRNVRERLDTLYAARHRFHSGAQGETWRVEIGLPFEQDTGRT